jgi:hypothetical protein
MSRRPLLDLLIRSQDEKEWWGRVAVHEAKYKLDPRDICIKSDTKSASRSHGERVIYLVWLRASRQRLSTPCMHKSTAAPFTPASATRPCVEPPPLSAAALDAGVGSLLGSPAVVRHRRGILRAAVDTGHVTMMASYMARRVPALLRQRVR